MPRPARQVERVRPEPGGERLTVRVRAGRKGTGHVVAARSVGTEPGGWHGSVLLRVRASISREVAAAGYVVVDVALRW